MRTSPTVLGALAALSFLAACGSDAASSGDDVASLATVATTSPEDAPEATSPQTSTSDEDAVLAYVECMRDEGIDLPDPVVADDGTVGFDTAGISVDPTADAFTTATEICEPLLDGADIAIGNDEMTAFRDAFQRFTDCLRAEGLDVGDFTFGNGNARRVVTGGGELIELVAPAIDGLDPSDPAHQTAVDQCEPTLSEAFQELAVGGEQ